MPVIRHTVKMFKTDDQPLEDHVSFASGVLPGTLMEYPHEYYHMPIVVWAKMGAPDVIWIDARLPAS